MTNHILTTCASVYRFQPALTCSFVPQRVALLVLVVFPVIASAQGMLPGCQLVNGSSSAEPGL